MMKKYFKYALTVAISIFFVSCYEVNEDIEINADGSGTYVTKMDMSALIDMMQTFAGEEELQKEGLDRVLDTTIMFRSLLDSTKDATAEQKELMKDGKMKMQMNIKEKIFKLDMNLPYKDLNSLQKLMSGKASSGTGMNAALSNLFGKKDGQQDAAQKGPDMSDFAAIYNVTIKKDLIEKKVNQEKYKEFMARPEMAQLKQYTTSGLEILYTTTIKLPRAAKNPDNPLIKLSEDKKTVTMRYNLLELLENPEKFAYSIQY
jgi:hypothetical protein